MQKQGRVVINGAAARLRDDIDRGRTGDKVDWPDPSAAPLGTDDEAGAAPTPHTVIEKTRLAERARSPSPPKHNGLGATWVLIYFVVSIGAIFVTSAFLIR